MPIPPKRRNQIDYPLDRAELSEWRKMTKAINEAWKRYGDSELDTERDEEIWKAINTYHAFLDRHRPGWRKMTGASTMDFKKEIATVIEVAAPKYAVVPHDGEHIHGKTAGVHNVTRSGKWVGHIVHQNKLGGGKESHDIYHDGKKVGSYSDHHSAKKGLIKHVETKNWFNGLSAKQKETYLKLHPHSRHRVGASNMSKQEMPTGLKSALSKLEDHAKKTVAATDISPEDVYPTVAELTDMIGDCVSFGECSDISLQSSNYDAKAYFCVTIKDNYKAGFTASEISDMEKELQAFQTFKDNALMASPCVDPKAGLVGFCIRVNKKVP